MGRSGFKREAITLDIIMYIPLQRAIGLNFSRVIDFYSLGMRTIKVAFNEGRIQ